MNGSCYRSLLHSDDTSFVYPGDLSLRVIRIVLACTQTLFHFSLPSFRKHLRLFSSFPAATPLSWRSITPPRGFLSHALDGLEKIGGL